MCQNKKVILCVTIRQVYADIFWFTLFHEMGHLINNDIKDKYFDFFNKEDESEKKADLFARDTLIDPEAFENFIKKQNFDYESVKEFADSQEIEDFIIIGRLQKLFNDYKFLHNKKPKYKWIV